ncbi:hypothetical protein DFH07DRAFT_70303 [Mycena maculata]|uniref:Uncharacterized protein n=1 Tax=Mycena maculata TaxID=230809 RepID=A0AAD7ICC5_9AGAR|nr:hypothetical protein DFH07DRAFT_70303 [Mycena maculata]
MKAKLRVGDKGNVCPPSFQTTTWVTYVVTSYPFLPLFAHRPILARVSHPRGRPLTWSVRHPQGGCGKDRIRLRVILGSAGSHLIRFRTHRVRSHRFPQKSRYSHQVPEPIRSLTLRRSSLLLIYCANNYLGGTDDRCTMNFTRSQAVRQGPVSRAFEDRRIIQEWNAHHDHRRKFETCIQRKYSAWIFKRLGRETRNKSRQTSTVEMCNDYRRLSICWPQRTFTTAATFWFIQSATKRLAAAGRPLLDLTMWLDYSMRRG